MHRPSAKSAATSVRALILALTAAAVLAACGGRAPPPDTVALSVSMGSVQCEGGGTPPAEWERRLAAAGVRPVASGCGVDGLMRPAVCGAPDGRIFIVDVRADQAPAAAALGFAPLANLPDAARGALPVNALLNALLTVGPLALLAALIAAPLYYLAWRRAPEPKRALPDGRYALTTLAAGALAYVAGAVGGVWAACSPVDAGNLCGLFGIFGFGPLAAAVAVLLYARSAAGNARRAP